ncbi:MAG: hypothetical protein GY932_08740 [Arcobacter sp.]|nr:hypothetical protein [Arcobacter sp.]
MSESNSEYIMATSADKLSQILQIAMEEARSGKTNEEVMGILAEQDLLPKKLLTKKVETAKTVSIFASKQAEELAAGLELDVGAGSGKDGRYTLSDIKKMLEAPKEKPPAISPSALQLANEHDITVTDIVGSGKDGRIILKDIHKAISDSGSGSDGELNISPHARKSAEEAGIPLHKLKTIQGSGKDGRVILSDVEKFKSESEEKSSSSDSEDSSDDEEKTPKSEKKIAKKKQ